MQPALTLDLAAVAARFAAIRGATEALAAPLTPEDCALQSAPFASPVKWHLAHTSWFFETFVLAEFVARYAPLRPEYRVLFNSYYQAIGERHPRPERGLLSRPSLDDVRAYRHHVDRALADLLASRAGQDPRVVARIELGLQHEQQHQELLLTDVKHLFWKSPLRPAYRTQPAAARAKPTTATKAEWRAFPGGGREIGVDFERVGRGGGFAYDNEGPRHRVLVPAFELASRLVTNGEFVAFIEDGGYRRPELWLSEGFDFVRADRVEAPLYWSRDGAQRDGWSLFTLDGMRALDPDEPLCHVSFFEADAFARWAGARLPTEFEWESAAVLQGTTGNFAGDFGANFVESGALHPRGGSASLFGDVWQWTSSAYAPYPGYRAAEGALGEYNGKFMVNQLVLRGGSCVSPRSHLRATYRNFFHAHDRWQFMGLRLARDAR